jgi:conflict system STAND superfamily ATPase
MALTLPSPEDVRSWIRILRGRRRDKALLLVATFVATAAGSVEYWPTEIQSFLRPVHPGCVLGILASIVYTLWLVQIWRQAQPPRREVTVRPPAVKGPASFGPQDGELFLKLGRERELGNLLGLVLDDQVGLVVLMGESGAGKTSLLRSGLTHVLTHQQQPPIPCIYWEILPSDPVTGLLTAIQRQFDPPEAAPATLEALEQLDDSNRVILVDQLEQLDPHLPAHAPLFDLLRRIGERRPPFRVTWIVAFRREFDPVWRDLEIDYPGLRFRMVPLNRFDQESAEAVLTTLADTVELTLDRALVQELVRSTADLSGRVSPVDIGIGLLLLDQLARRDRPASLSLADYHFAGGSEALLANYLSNRLGGLAEEDRKAFLRALLLLVDPGTNHRVAEGKTSAGLAVEAGRPPAWTAAYLDALTADRVLEKVNERYRLQHERLIPPLRTLSGQLLAESDRARQILQEAYARWMRHPGAGGPLLAGADLRLVLRHHQVLLVREPEMVDFLHRSAGRRRAWRAAVAAGLIGALFGAWAAGHAVRHAIDRAAVLAAGLPPDLLDHLGQLQSLHLSVRTNNLGWIRVPLKELEFNALSLRELPTLPNSLVRLTINNGDPSLIDALPPLPNLEELTISGVPLTHLPRMEHFPKLQKLTVSVGKRRDINVDLEGLQTTKVKELTILAMESPRFAAHINLPTLPRLEALTTAVAVSLPPGGMPALKSLEIRFGAGLVFPSRNGCEYARRSLAKVEHLLVSRPVFSGLSANLPPPACFPRLRELYGAFQNDPRWTWRISVSCTSEPFDFSADSYPHLRWVDVEAGVQCPIPILPPTVEAVTIHQAPPLFTPEIEPLLEEIWRQGKVREVQIVSEDLSRFWLENAPIDLSNLAKVQLPMSSVKVLKIGPASLPTLGVLSKFPNLEELYATDLFLYVDLEPMTSLQNLPAFPELRVLHFSGAGLSDLRSLPRLPKLWSLNLTGNPLKSLEGIPPTVRELYF